MTSCWCWRAFGFRSWPTSVSGHLENDINLTTMVINLPKAMAASSLVNLFLQFLQFRYYMKNTMVGYPEDSCTPSVLCTGDRGHYRFSILGGTVTCHPDVRQVLYHIWSCLCHFVGTAAELQHTIFFAPGHARPTDDFALMNSGIHLCTGAWALRATITGECLNFFLVNS